MKYLAFAALAASLLTAAPAIAADQNFWPDAGVHIVDHVDFTAAGPDFGTVTVEGNLYRASLDPDNPNGVGTITFLPGAVDTICYRRAGSAQEWCPYGLPDDYYAVFYENDAGPIGKEPLAIVYLRDDRG